MSIAVLGWGSLIWCPGTLRTKTKWRSDGPVLPIEFARISRDNRLTLVIHLGSAPQPTYWALSEFITVPQARDNLCARENSKSADIHYLAQDGSAADGSPQEIVNRVREWLTPHKDLEAVIWTGLPSNWSEKRGHDFSHEDAIRFLIELEAKRDHDAATYFRAREYVTNTPPLVDTNVRQAMRVRGWVDALLPATLFEP